MNDFIEGPSDAVRDTRPSGPDPRDIVATIRGSGLFDAKWYALHNPDAAGSDDDLLTHYLAHGQAFGRDPHPLFTTESYLSHSPDVAASGANPLEHFLTYGAMEGRSPHPAFDTKWYLKHHPELADRNENPLKHYLQHGSVVDNCGPNPLFDTAWYLSHCPDVAASGDNPLIHYLLHGAAEGRDPHPLFDTKWYLARCPDVAASNTNPLAHYLASGAAEGRSPHPLFDPAWYGSQNPDLTDSGGNPLKHYVLNDTAAGYDPHPLFDTEWYLANHPDVAATGANPLTHYVTHGAAEGRNPHPLFDGQYYLAQQPQLMAATTNPLMDYIQRGAAAGRDPNPSFDVSWYAWFYPEIRDSGLDPLVHYVTVGASKERPTSPPLAPPVTALAPMPHEPWSSPNGPEWVASFRLRLQDRLTALEKMVLSRPFAEAITFSLTTAAYNTKPKFLWKLAETLRQQAFQDFEWVILDNGSTDPRTILALQDIAASDCRFRLFREEHNLHIIGGNRYVLDRATGRYIVPVDSDDLLYPDSLALFANVLRGKAEPPTVLYSDEQKVTEEGEPFELMWRWNYSLAYANETVPAAHLMAIATEFARETGLYGDDYARGSHDWDSWLRLSERKISVEHVPEVLYGWRIHAESTAGSSSSKSYIGKSQTEVVDESLRRRGLFDLFKIEQLFSDPGWYRAVRQTRDCPPCEIDFIVGVHRDDLTRAAINLTVTRHTPGRKRVLYPAFREHAVARARSRAEDCAAGVEWVSYVTNEELAGRLNEVGSSSFAKILISSSVRLRSSRAVWDALGTLELDPWAGIVSGPIVSSNDLVLTAGYMAGVENAIATPFAGWARNDVPGHIWYLRRRITAAPTLFIAVRREALLAAPLSGMDEDDALYGLDLCRRCAHAGYTTIQVLGMEAERDRILPRIIGEGSASGMRQATEVLADKAMDFTLSPHLSRQSNRFGKLARPDDRKAPVRMDLQEVAPAIPLNLSIDPDLADRPTINLLLPIVRTTSLSGGPNTALNLGYRLADMGFPLRIISTDLPPDADLTPMWRHIRSISSVDKPLAHVEIVSGADRSTPLAIGANDIFLATAWWTAQMVKHATMLVGNRPFLYLVQDFEPLFYPTSTLYAVALETYSLDHLPIINTSLLRDYLIENAIGRYADAGFGRAALCFEPAIDRNSFFPESHDRQRRRLLFYARPTYGVRNLFPIGLAALRSAIARGTLSPLQWDFVGMGEHFAPIDLGHGATLTCAPWLGFDDYAEQMRHSDLLLSLMMSPHPSYPPLEMGSCNGLVITNVFANKTAERLAAFSDQIIAVEPNVEAITEALGTAAARIEASVTISSKGGSPLPENWDASFADVLPELSRRLIGFGLRPDGRLQSVTAVKMPGSDQQGDPYSDFLTSALAKRSRLCAAPFEPGLISFVTMVWNTAPEFLEVLARSVRDQRGGTGFEWYVLDNGSTDPDTLAAIERLREFPFVRVERSETNLGIIGGTRHCLERATTRYILPLDHDDYVFPDAARVVTWYLQKYNYPPLLYTDETLLAGTKQFAPYMKPDWDPVLFINSCYTSHLGAIDRALALQYGAYTDKTTEACPDWDVFTRFAIAGHIPVHVPEILYSWRAHEQSTAGNIRSKPYVAASQQRVVGRFLAAQPCRDKFQVQASPFFHANADWWLRRQRTAPRRITTILIRSEVDGGRTPNFHISAAIDHSVVEMHLHDGLSALLPHLDQCVKDDRLVHIQASETYPNDDEWAWEAMGLLEMFPDTVIVGGSTHSHNEILQGRYCLGFGLGFESPDRGVPVSNPGYFGQLWKPNSVDAVTGQHFVAEPAFLIRAIKAALNWSGTLPGLGRWAGAAARAEGRRVIYSPFLGARTEIDWDAHVQPAEQGRMVAAFSHFIPNTGSLSPNLGLTTGTAHTPTIRSEYVPTRSGAMLPPYAQWFDCCQNVRRADYSLVPEGPSFSLLTTLYSGTDTDLFKVTAQLVDDQTYDRFEWVILAHGPVTPTLDSVLRQLEHRPYVRVLRLPFNLGIIGGMRHVLDAAHGDYVLPLDGDDLLTTDCLQILAAVIAKCETPPAYLYSDEDIIVGGQLSAPFLRPSWDPVLDLENSWIWHVGVFRRDLGLALGVYTDKGSEYCHDWDTVYRFTSNGHQPLHIPETLYHWRHHEQSTSNRVNPGQGSSNSVQYLLARKIAERGLSEAYEIAPFPIYRGAAEWWVHGKSATPPPTRCIVLDTASDTLPTSPGFLRNDMRIVALDAAFFVGIQDAIGGLADDFLVMLVSDQVYVADGSGLLEAVKLFAFHPDVAIVSGRLLNGDSVIAAGLMLDGQGRLRAPYDGQSLSYPSQFALGLKPQTITIPVLDLCFITAGFLRSALEARPLDCTASELGLWLGAFSMAAGRRVAFSPLISGEIKGLPLRVRDARIDAICWRHFRGKMSVAEDDRTRTGAAGYTSQAFTG